MGHKTNLKILGLMVLCATSCSLGGSGDEPSGPLSARQTSESIIRADIAPAIEVDELAPVCSEIDNPQVGTVFRCSAKTSDDRIVYINGQIEQDGRISLATSNVLIPSDLESFEQAAIEYTNLKKNTNYSVNSFSCGDETIILDENRVVRCSFIDPATGNIHDSKVRINDIENRVVEVQIDQDPRA